MISQKLKELKSKFNRHKIDGYIVPKNDEYFSEFAQKDKLKTITGFNYRMTEMQAAVGKIQLKKLDTVIRESKKRYLAIYKKILKNKELEFREIPKNSEQIYDTLIFFVKNKALRKKIIKVLVENGIGTKNLPKS